MDSPADASAGDTSELLADPKVRQALAGKIPSRRNREIFRAVAVAHRCQRDVAKEFGVSQPRISQIVQQVTRWLSENVVEQDRPCNGLAQILIAENLLRMQYDHLYATALDLLHGRTSGNRESTDAESEKQDQPPHKPNPAFLNAAARVVNSRAKFEGLIGRPVQRAMNEASWRGVSQFGPMNDGLKPDKPQEHEEEGAYNPLSADDETADEPAQTAQQVSEGFRGAYERYADWFPGDFSARAAYYRTQVERVFGPEPDDDRPEETACSSVSWIHGMDLMAAEAHQAAAERAASEPVTGSPPENIADCRRSELIRIMLRDQWVLCEEDAVGLLEEGEYDEASGRFAWDQRFTARTAGSHK